MRSKAVPRREWRRSASAPLRAFSDPLKYISILAGLEVSSALQRRLRLHEITREAFDIATASLAEALEQYPQLDIDQRTVTFATGLLARHLLRSLDALQLATVLLLREEIGPGNSLLFVASDGRLLDAAAAERLDTWNPDDRTAPPVN